MIEHLRHMADVRPEGLDRDAADWAIAEIARLREFIVMADNRLEIADCPQCVEVARSYLQEALAERGE